MRHKAAGVDFGLGFGVARGFLAFVHIRFEDHPTSAAAIRSRVNGISRTRTPNAW